MQESIEFDPSWSKYVPWGHFKHEDESFAAKVKEYVPDGHLMQSERDIAPNFVE